MIDIIHFSATDSYVFNYIFDACFTVFLVAIPIRLISDILKRASKWF